MRLLYFYYYFRQIRLKPLIQLIEYAKLNSSRNGFSILFDMIFCSWHYKISFEDYFIFKFYINLDPIYRKSWIGAGFMYEYQKLMNPKKYRPILKNKILFLNLYKSFVRRRWYALDFANLSEVDFRKVEEIANAASNGRFVVKSSLGQAGGQVLVLDSVDYTPSEITEMMRKKKFDLLEEAVVQHPDLMRLAPDGLNTIRVITQIDNFGVVHVLGCRLRVTDGGRLDNFHQGGFVVVVDTQTGQISSNGVYRMPGKQELVCHPTTLVQLIGFQIPLWDDVISICQEAAGCCPELRTVGWDVAIRADGVELIEGNDNWNYGTYQLPLSKGLKGELMLFLE